MARNAEEIRCALGALADDPNANGTLAAIGAASRPRLAPYRHGAVQPERKWSAACFEEHETWVLGAPEVLLADDDPLRDDVAEPARGRRVMLLGRSAERIDEPVLPEDLTPRRSSP